MDFKEIQALIDLFEASGLNEIEVEQDGRRIRLSKGGGAPAYYAPAPPAPAPVVENAPSDTAKTKPEEKGGGLADGLATIDSPMVGTFYAASTPGEPPFVLPGDSVQKDKTICIVEAMKIMNEVTAKFPCVIERILVENGEPVEFGQPLFAVRPLA